MKTIWQNVTNVIACRDRARRKKYERVLFALTVVEFVIAYRFGLFVVDNSWAIHSFWCQALAGMLISIMALTVSCAMTLSFYLSGRDK